MLQPQQIGRRCGMHRGVRLSAAELAQRSGIAKVTVKIAERSGRAQLVELAALAAALGARSTTCSRCWELDPQPARRCRRPTRSRSGSKSLGSRSGRRPTNTHARMAGSLGAGCWSVSTSSTSAARSGPAGDASAVTAVIAAELARFEFLGRATVPPVLGVEAPDDVAVSPLSWIRAGAARFAGRCCSRSARPGTHRAGARHPGRPTELELLCKASRWQAGEGHQTRFSAA